MAQKNILELKNIKKLYGENIILDNYNLEVKENEFLTLLGPSGCGKTTLLRIIGGFEEIDKGVIIFDGMNITNLEPYNREINTVFQKYALFPHLNVYENIAFGLKIKKMKKSLVKLKVKEILELVNLGGYEDRKIDSLSGGQQQRIAIARALVNEPKILLLDEPLGALDLKLRKEMQLELKNIQMKLGITFIYVTHDQEEALSMSDRIVILNDGRIQQIGTPVDIYNEPENTFVAKFIGESNIFDGIMLEDYRVKFVNNYFNCVDYGFNKNEIVDVVIRPEDLEIRSIEKSKIIGVVESVVFKGVHYELRVNQKEYIWKVHTTLNVKEGEKIGLYIEPENIHIMKR